MYVITSEKFIFSYDDVQKIIDAVSIYGIRTVDEFTKWLANAHAQHEAKIVTSYRDIKLPALNLSTRANNSIMLHLDKLGVLKTLKQGEVVTVGHVIDNIPSLRAVKNCGVNTAKEITKRFHDLGANTDAWEYETRIWYKRVE